MTCHVHVAFAMCLKYASSGSHSPVEEWFKYAEEVRNRVLADLIVEGFPYSEALVKKLSE